ncbi:MAG: hypothetical protein K2N44_08320 [Lachnospiraceae bacterium]|nr:hypothetical protein [Lachnospiraceae bacterium]
MRADFRRKEPEVAARECVIEKVIVLPDEEYDFFTKHLLHDYDFIDQNRGMMGEWNGAWHCLLVTGDNAGEGVLVQSEGASYARYSAFVPFVSDLIVQENCMECGREVTTQTEGCSQQMV